MDGSDRKTAVRDRVIMLGAWLSSAAVAWQLSKVSIPEWLTGWILMIMMVGAAVFVFLLPFFKHVPARYRPPPVVELALTPIFLILPMRRQFAEGEGGIFLVMTAVMFAIVLVEALRPRTETDAQS